LQALLRRNMDKKQTHLTMIQGVINRLSQNSFLLKGWSIVLISALFALAASNRRMYFIYLTYFPLIAFWILDGYFLWQERLARALYDHVRKKSEEDIDFSMDVSTVKNQVRPWSDVILSMTLLLFHGTLLISIIVVMMIFASITKGCN
jgi:hypothetical protein